MGGCTSKDKTVAEGCVKHFFSSFFLSLSLPLLASVPADNNDSLRWHTQKERECDEFSASVPQKSLSLTPSITFQQVPIPSLDVTVCEQNEKIKFAQKKKQSCVFWRPLKIFDCCHRRKNNAGLVILISNYKRNLLQYHTFFGIVRRLLLCNIMIIPKINTSNSAFACWVGKYWYKLHTRIFSILLLVCRQQQQQKALLNVILITNSNFFAITIVEIVILISTFYIIIMT